ncbi:hypothetical protein SBADM41S_06814 [Streptomyces badius]
MRIPPKTLTAPSAGPFVLDRTRSQMPAGHLIRHTPPVPPQREPHQNHDERKEEKHDKPPTQDLPIRQRAPQLLELGRPPSTDSARSDGHTLKASVQLEHPCVIQSASQSGSDARAATITGRPHRLVSEVADSSTIRIDRGLVSGSHTSEVMSRDRFVYSVTGELIEVVRIAFHVTPVSGQASIDLDDAREPVLVGSGSWSSYDLAAPGTAPATATSISAHGTGPTANSGSTPGPPFGKGHRQWSPVQCHRFRLDAKPPAVGHRRS